MNELVHTSLMCQGDDRLGFKIFYTTGSQQSVVSFFTNG